MKRRSNVILVAMMTMCFLLMCGCSKKTTAENLNIEMDENPTTGYTWVYDVTDKDIVKVVSDEFKGEDTDKVGAGGVHTYVIQGLKEGETTIEFTSRQDWEGGEKGESKTITISVDKDLTVTEKQ